MKLKTGLMIVVAVSAIGIGAVAFKATPQKAEAAGSSTASIVDSLVTPGNFRYINIVSASTSSTENTKWYSAGHKTSIRFKDANGHYAYSEWATSHAFDGSYFFAIKVPTHEDNGSQAAWTSVQAICYTSTATSPSNDFVASGTAFGANPTTIAMTAEITTTGQKGADNVTIPSGVATTGILNEIAIVSTAVVPDSKVASNTVKTITGYYSGNWTSTLPEFDKMSYWCGSSFLPYTDIVCGAVGASNFQSSLTYYWNNLSTSYSALSTTAKGYFTAQSYPNTGSVKYDTIANGVGRYKRIYNNYHAAYSSIVTNFAGLGGLAAASNVPLTSTDDSAAYVLGGLAVVSALAATSYFIIRKKKQA